jgi:hypothetical protein
MPAALQPHKQIQRATLILQASRIKDLPKSQFNQRYPKNTKFTKKNKVFVMAV